MFLYVDDEPDNLELFRLQFGDRLAVETVTSAEAALESLEVRRHGVLLTDERMPGTTGIELLSVVAQRWPTVVRIIVSAYSDSDRLLRAINVGRAHEYVLKPWKMDELGRSLERWQEMARRRHLLEQAAALASVSREDAGRASVVAVAQSTRSALEGARQAGSKGTNFVVWGEPGTGRTMLARAAHEAGLHPEAPFVVVPCRGATDEAMERTLFGPPEDRGRWVLARGGTLVLRDIDRLPSSAQSRLLGHLAAPDPEQSPARVISISERRSAALIDSGAFETELAHRLAVVEFGLEPLRERREDLLPLLLHLLERHAPDGRAVEVDPDAVAALEQYGWPGNVLELENVAQRALLFGDDTALALEDFCLRLDAATPTVRERARTAATEELRRALVSAGGNCARAARILDIPRTTLISRAKKAGLL